MYAFRNDRKTHCRRNWPESGRVWADSGPDRPDDHQGWPKFRQVLPELGRARTSSRGVGPRFGKGVVQLRPCLVEVGRCRGLSTHPHHLLGQQVALAAPIVAQISALSVAREVHAEARPSLRQTAPDSVETLPLQRSNTTPHSVGTAPDLVGSALIVAKQRPRCGGTGHTGGRNRHNFGRKGSNWAVLTPFLPDCAQFWATPPKIGSEAHRIWSNALQTTWSTPP